MTAATADVWIQPRAGQALQPADAAIEYLRRYCMQLVPVYVLAMAPFSVVVFLLIDAIYARHREALPFYCLLLTGATAWRWIGLGMLQRGVQTRLRGDPPRPLRDRLPAILLARLSACMALTWGSFLVLPSFYGLFLSGFAAPILLEHEGRALPAVLRALGWIHRAAWRLCKVALAFALAGLLLLIGLLAFQLLLTETVLPDFLGLRAQDLALTLGSGAWGMCLLYLVCLPVDLLWAIASVMLFYDLQARRLGTDLRARIQALGVEEEGP